MSLRLRVALVSVATTAAVVALAGATLLALVAKDQRDAVDHRLTDQARVAAQRAAVLLYPERPRQDRLPLERLAPNLNLVSRAVSEDEVVLTFGDYPLEEGDEAEPGYSTVVAAGERWRVLSVPAAELAPALFDRSVRENEPPPEDVTIEVASPTAEINDTVGDVRRQVVRLGGVAVLAAALGGWFLGGAALRPLARLRRDAERVSGTDDLDIRVADRQGLREVDELGRSLNHMLERLEEASQETEAALEASRAFAANAAHELRTPLTSMQANLDILAANPGLPDHERGAVVAEIATQQHRLIRLLEALRLLARGDLSSVLPDEEVSMVDLVDEAVQAARRRHPRATFTVGTGGDPATIAGWREGLRVLVDNVLDNAVVHGGRGGTATVSVEVDDHHDGDRPAVRLVIDDDGPGIPAKDRERVLGRFTRAGTNAPGSGLGLALVAQQAELHGGTVQVEDSPAGGARVIVTLHAGMSGEPERSGPDRS